MASSRPDHAQSEAELPPTMPQLFDFAAESAVAGRGGIIVRRCN